MQIVENESNKPLFDDTFCLVTANGELKQKDNSFFSGKVLKSDITEDFENHIEPFKTEFKKLEAEILSDSDSKFDELLKKASEAQAIGDFETLLVSKQSASSKETPADSDTTESDISATSAISSDDTAETPQPVDAEPVKKATDPSTAEDKEADQEIESDQTEVSTETEDASSDPENYYRLLVDEAKEVAQSTNWSGGQALLDAIARKWSEGPEIEATVLEQLHSDLEKERQTFFDKKAESQKRYEEKKEKNFITREELLTRLQKIIDQKKWQAQGEVNSIQRKFENLRPLPAEGIEDQNKKLQELLSIFKENRVNFMVEIRQKEEDNLTGKLITLEKIEEISTEAGEKTENWSVLNEDISKLTRQWKKIGRVPKEKENEVWDRFRAAQNSFNEKRMKFDEEYKKEIEQSILTRESLISKAESLLSTDDLAAAARDINRLHAEWKKLENLPKELNDELWNRFKEASDKFNEIKSENISVIKDQEQENLEAKEALCEQAEALASADNFRDGTKKMDELFKKWKEIGPVPGKKSRQVWRRFRGAMDSFYKNRRAHFKEMKAEQQENLKRKNEIIDRIKELTTADDLEAVVKEVQELQAEYKKIGFVPIKLKDKVWNTFRDTCDQFFDLLREKGGRGRAQSSSPSGGGSEQKITSELFKLRKEADKIRDEILKYKDTMTYFKPNKKGLELREEIQINIDKSEKKLDSINSRIEELQQELNQE